MNNWNTKFNIPLSVIQPTDVFSPYTDEPSFHVGWDMAESVITESSNDISAISNLGTNGGPLAQGTPLDQPTYDTTTNSFPVALFDGVDHNMTSDDFSPVLAMERSIFIVYRLIDLVGVQYIVNHQTGADLTFRANSNTNYNIGWKNTQHAGGVPDTNFHVVLLEFSNINDNQSMWIDGVIVVDHELTLESALLSNLTLGQRANGANSVRMEFYALSDFNALLSDEVKNKIGNYYANIVGTSGWSL